MLFTYQTPAYCVPFALPDTGHDMQSLPLASVGGDMPAVLMLTGSGCSCFLRQFFPQQKEAITCGSVSDGDRVQFLMVTETASGCTAQAWELR